MYYQPAMAGRVGMEHSASTDLSLAKQQDNEARRLIASGNYPEALIKFKYALSNLARTKLGENSAEYGEILTNMGLLYQHLGLYNEALQALKKAEFIGLSPYSAVNFSEVAGHLLSVRFGVAKHQKLRRESRWPSTILA